MKRVTVMTVGLALTFAWAVTLAAQSRKGQPKAAAGAAEAIIYDAQSAMAFLTTLTGEWVAGGAEHEHGSATAANAGARSFKTKAAGSAVVQTTRAGTPGEMKTIFHMDGDQLLLTHYCAQGNQPRLVEGQSVGRLHQLVLLLRFALGYRLTRGGQEHHLGVCARLRVTRRLVRPLRVGASSARTWIRAQQAHAPPHTRFRDPMP